MSAVMTHQMSRLERLDGLRRVFLSKSKEELTEGFKILFPHFIVDEQSLEAAFNHYFVGPQKPVVAPYASLYLEESVLMMSNSTQFVRELYELMGFVNPFKNKEPDDFLGFELDAYYQLTYIEEKKGIEYLSELRRYFLMHHMSPWVNSFVEKGLCYKDYDSKEIVMILKALKNCLKDEVNHEGGKS